MTNTGQRGSPGGAGCDCAGDGKQLDPHTHTGMCKVTNRHCQGDPADQVRLPDAPEGYVKAGYSHSGNRYSHCQTKHSRRHTPNPQHRAGSQQQQGQQHTEGIPGRRTVGYLKVTGSSSRTRCSVPPGREYGSSIYAAVIFLESWLQPSSATVIRTAQVAG